jgi:hypothetical protein
MINLLHTLSFFNIIQWFIDLKKIGLNTDKSIILSFILLHEGMKSISNDLEFIQTLFKEEIEYIKNLTKDILDENEIKILIQGVECFINT